jgi:hypothetical protein
MFLQKFDILINKQASPITNFNDEVTKLPSGDDITRFDGTDFLTYRCLTFLSLVSSLSLPSSCFFTDFLTYR